MEPTAKDVCPGCRQEIDLRHKELLVFTPRTVWHSKCANEQMEKMMTFRDLYGWVNGETTMFLVSQGEITPIDVDRYQALNDVPKDAKFTTSYRTAAVLADYQRLQAVERS